MAACGATLIGERVTGVRVTPISGRSDLGSGAGRVVSGAGSGGGGSGGGLSGVGLSGVGDGGGGMPSTVRGVVGGAVGDGDSDLVVYGESRRTPLRESRETSSTADTRMARTARPIIAMANTAGFVQYHGTGTGLASGRVSMNP